MAYINVSTLVVILYYNLNCFHWRKLGKNQISLYCLLQLHINLYLKVKFKKGSCARRYKEVTHVLAIKIVYYHGDTELGSQWFESGQSRLVMCRRQFSCKT